jgi:hypothetical protein
MARPKLNGTETDEVQETSPVVTAQAEAPASPAPEAESPVKQIVFMSVDKELVLYYKAGEPKKLPDGRIEMGQTLKVQFLDFSYRIADIPANQFAIGWLRKHDSFGVSFMEVQDIDNMVELPSIEEMRKLPMAQLKELCRKKEVSVKDDASRESIILALIENGK